MDAEQQAPESGCLKVSSKSSPASVAGAIAGMVSGGATVFIWKLLLNPLGGIFGIYELLPAFLVSCIVIVAVSLLTKEPSEEIGREFEQAKAQAKAS